MEDINLKDLYDGNFYHVCTDGLEQTTLLKDDEDFKVAWNYLALSAWRTGVQVMAFIQMSNHIHELLACRSASQADKTIKLYKKMLSMYLKKRYGTSKVLHRAKDCISLIDSIQYLKNALRIYYGTPYVPGYAPNRNNTDGPAMHVTLQTSRPARPPDL